MWPPAPMPQGRWREEVQEEAVHLLGLQEWRWQVIEINWKGNEYLVNEDRITWVTKAKHNAHGDTTEVIVNFSEVGANKTVRFYSDDGNAEQLYATIKVAMGTSKNKFRYTGKEDKKDGA